MRTKTKSKKSLTDQATDLVEQVQPHVEAARERIVNDYLPVAQSVLADARDAARDVAADAKVAAQEAAANAEKSTRKSRKKAAKKTRAKARSMLDTAVAAAPAGMPLVEKAKKKPKRKKRVVLLLGLVGLGAILVRRLRGEAPGTTTYTPPARPAPRPSVVPEQPVASTPPAPPKAPVEPDTGPGAETTDKGGSFLDEVVADADEAPHEVTTPDQPAEAVDVTDVKDPKA